MPSHPLVPVIQITATEAIQQCYGQDLDLVLEEEASGWSDKMLQLIVDVITHQYTPRLHHQGNIDFQITRGLLGISL